MVLNMPSAYRGLRDVRHCGISLAYPRREGPREDETKKGLVANGLMRKQGLQKSVILTLVAITSLSAASWQVSAGRVATQFYGNLGTGTPAIEGTAIEDLTSAGNFPGNPAAVSGGQIGLPFLTEGLVWPVPFEEGDFANNYGTMTEGFISVPTGGEWKFFVRSDDASQFELNSSGPDPSGAEVIAEEPECCNDFVDDGTRSSDAISLEPGTEYYFRMLHKEGSGGDWWQVGWQGPNMDEPRVVGSEFVQEFTTEGAPEIVTQPQDVSVAEGERAVIGVTVTGARPMDYQWSRDGSEIDGANNPFIVIDPASVDDGGAEFSVAISNSEGDATSDTATLEVEPDETAPTIESADPRIANINKVDVEFSEQIDEASGTDPANYSINNDVTIDSVELGENGRSVTLSTTGIEAGVGGYELTVDGVMDRSAEGNEVSSETRSLTLFPGGLVQDSDGFVVFEAENFDERVGDFWQENTDRGNPSGGASMVVPNGAGGDEASSQLLYDINFTRTGEHVVWYRASGEGGSDDSGWLHIDGERPPSRTDGNQASMTGFGGESDFVWNSAPQDGGGQMTFNLESAGQHTFGLAQREDGSFFDKFIITTNPDFTPEGTGPEPTRGSGEPLPNASIEITKQPESKTVELGPSPVTATFTIEAQAFSGDEEVGNRLINWIENGEVVAGGPSFTTEELTLEDDGRTLQALVRMPGARKFSNEVTLNVNPDSTPPTLLKRANGVGGLTGAIATFSEPLDPETAETAANYAVAGPEGNSVSVNGATLLPGGKRVMIETAQLTTGNQYTLTVNNVADRSENKNTIAADSQAVFFGINADDPPGDGLPVPTNSWLFDSGSGDTAAAFTGGVPGSIDNGATFSSDTPFGSGNSIEFDGEDDEVNMGALTYNGASAITMSFWIRSDSTEADMGWWEAVDSGGGDLWGLRYDSTGATSGSANAIKTGMALTTSNGNLNRGEDQQESMDNVQTTDWQHIAYTWEDGEGFKLYIDGQLDDPNSPVSTTEGKLALMEFFRLGDGSKAHWDGKIDEVGVWENIALNESQIQWLADPSHSLGSIEGLPPKPSIEMMGPEPLTQIKSGNVTISASAATEKGQIDLVEFFADGEKIGETTSSPYEFTWQDAPNGVFNLTARVTNSLLDAAETPGAQVVVGDPTSELPGDFVTSLYGDGTRFIEHEDYNYEEGQWIEGANGGPTGQPYDGGAYEGLKGVNGIDFNDEGGGGPDADDLNPYRWDEADAGDVPGPATVDFNDPAIKRDRGTFTVENTWKVGWTSEGEWYNYTRDFPEEETTYEVYAHISSGGSDPMATLQRVTSDPTQEDQSTEDLGQFSGPASGDWGTAIFYKMHEVGNAEASETVTLSGVNTIRWLRGSGDQDLNYMAFVPVEPEAPKGPELSISLSEGTITVEWGDDSELETATSIGGPWQPSDQSSPATFSIEENAALYFRTVQ